VSKRPKPAQQGEPDGLCGIYSLLNFIHALPEYCAKTRKEQNEEDQEILRYLLEASHELGLMLPQMLSHGFEQYHLRAIFNRTCENLDINFRAKSLSSYASENKCKNVLKAIGRVVGEKGAAVVHLNEHDHWVLAYDINGVVVTLDDSSVWRDHDVGPYKVNGSKQKELGLDSLDGLALLPLKHIESECKNAPKN
jgi:hypothetical protein